MQRMLFVCLFVGAVAICLMNAAAPPIAGTWEATKDGRKAVTVKVHETDGILGGTVIVYIIHDNGTGEFDGAASEPMTLVGTTWDGRTLRFSVDVPGAAVTAFELRLTGADKGELRCTRSDGSVETDPVTRRK
jgi:hypothetical protein